MKLPEQADIGDRQDGPRDRRHRRPRLRELDALDHERGHHHGHERQERPGQRVERRPGVVERRERRPGRRHAESVDAGGRPVGDHQRHHAAEDRVARGPRAGRVRAGPPAPATRSPGPRRASTNQSGNQGASHSSSAEQRDHEPATIEKPMTSRVPSMVEGSDGSAEQLRGADFGTGTDVESADRHRSRSRSHLPSTRSTLRGPIRAGRPPNLRSRAAIRAAGLEQVVAAEVGPEHRR